MIYKIYSVLDAKTTFMTPTFDYNDLAAARNFKYAVTQTEGIFNANPEDFTLYCIGEFDSVSGAITGKTPPEFVTGGVFTD